MLPTTLMQDLLILGMTAITAALAGSYRIEQRRRREGNRMQVITRKDLITCAQLLQKVLPVTRFLAGTSDGTCVEFTVQIEKISTQKNLRTGKTGAETETKQ